MLLMLCFDAGFDLIKEERLNYFLTKVGICLRPLIGTKVIHSMVYYIIIAVEGCLFTFLF